MNNVHDALRLAESLKPKPRLVLADYYERAKSGELDAISLSSPLLTKMTQALVKGFVTVVCGPASVGKSLWITQNLIHWQRQGVRFAARFFEDDKDTYNRRILAQLDGNADLKHTDYPKLHPALADAAAMRHAATMDAIDQGIEASDDGTTNFDEVGRWAREKVDSGYRVLVIDPITAVRKEGIGYSAKPWDADRDFLFELKRIVANKASLIIVTHPSADGLRMSGGEAFSRFAHVTLQIKNNAEGKKYWVMSRVGTYEMVPERLIQITKAREGSGTGKFVAQSFARKVNPNDINEPMKLIFEDLGVVVAKPKGARSDDDE
jgi:hypothetical protein